MSLRITIDIFSGRPNPVIDVTGREARKILERVKPLERLRPSDMSAPEHVLGYRGLIIEQIGATRSGLPKIFRVAAGSIWAQTLPQHRRSRFRERFFQCARSRGSLQRHSWFPRHSLAGDRPPTRHPQTSQGVPSSLAWQRALPLCASL